MFYTFYNISLFTPTSPSSNPKIYIVTIPLYRLFPLSFTYAFFFTAQSRTNTIRDGSSSNTNDRLKFTSSMSQVCKSVHHRTIQIDHETDATNFQFIILTFIYSSTCFGRSPAHHQNLNDCSSNLWFYLRIVVTVVLCSWSGR